MEHKNKMVLEVESRSCNEGLARIAVAALYPTHKSTVHNSCGGLCHSTESYFGGGGGY